VSDTVFSGYAKGRTVNTPLNENELEALGRVLGKCRPCGAEPWTTLYNAIIREIKAKGKDARFKKTERGKFAYN